jgi:hypothetical protein
MTVTLAPRRRHTAWLGCWTMRLSTKSTSLETEDDVGHLRGKYSSGIRSSAQLRTCLTSGAGGGASTGSTDPIGAVRTKIRASELPGVPHDREHIPITRRRLSRALLLATARPTRQWRPRSRLRRGTAESRRLWRRSSSASRELKNDPDAGIVNVLTPKLAPQFCKISASRADASGRCGILTR